MFCIFNFACAGRSCFNLRVYLRQQKLGPFKRLEELHSSYQELHRVSEIWREKVLCDYAIVSQFVLKKIVQLVVVFEQLSKAPSNQSVSTSLDLVVKYKF